MSRRPDFVVIGAQKAASSFLQSSLRRHPQMWLPAGEDPFFRDPVYDPAGLAGFARPYSRRRELRLGMKCPDYLGRPEVPARLHRDLAVPDLIVCLRDPVQRALSAYFWWMRWGLIPIAPAEEGLRRILDGTHDAGEQVVAPILDWGRYHHHLSRYLEIFPREKLLVLLDEDLRRDAPAAIRRAHEFLGVDPDRSPPSTGGTRDNAGVYSLERLRLLNLRNRHMLHWDADRTHPTIPKPRNPLTRLYCNAIAATDRYLLARIHRDPKPVLSAELTGRLHAFYRDDLARLAGLIERDLTRWDRSGPVAGERR